MKKNLIYTFVCLLFCSTLTAQTNFFRNDKMVQIEPIDGHSLLRMDSAQYSSFTTYIGLNSNIDITPLVSNIFQINYNNDSLLFSKALNDLFLSDTVSVYENTANDTIYFTNKVFVKCNYLLSEDSVKTLISNICTDTVLSVECINQSKKNYLVTFNKLQSPLTANLIHNNNSFIFCEANLISKIDYFSNYYGDQWALNNTGQNLGVSGVDINVEDAWSLTSGNPTLVRDCSSYQLTTN